MGKLLNVILVLLFFIVGALHVAHGGLEQSTPAEKPAPEKVVKGMSS
jgi:UPF0716 family protein affecting phage T7 exclusion